MPAATRAQRDARYLNPTQFFTKCIQVRPSINAYSWLSVEFLMRASDCHWEEGCLINDGHIDWGMDEIVDELVAGMLLTQSSFRLFCPFPDRVTDCCALVNVNSRMTRGWAVFVKEFCSRHKEMGMNRYKILYIGHCIMCDNTGDVAAYEQLAECSYNRWLPYIERGLTIANQAILRPYTRS